MSAAPAHSTSTSHARFQPSVPIAIAMMLAYMVLVNGLQLTSGVNYADFFDNADNAMKSAVIPLAAGAVLLIVFALIAKWDMLWRDSARLPMTKVLWALPVLFTVTFIVRFFGISWNEIPSNLIVNVILAGALVGFAEEFLFRGIVLRGLREHRSEGVAAFWTAVLFGLFHVGNLLFGQGIGEVLLQMLIAAASGFTLYLFRRGFGVIIAGMIAHGLWDISTFLAGNFGHGALNNVAGAAPFVLAAFAIVMAIVILRRDKDIQLTAAGIVPFPPTP